MANRGLYGQAEGNEHRRADEWFEDRKAENELAEGEWINAMKGAAKKGDMKELARLRDAMKASFIKGGVPAALAQQRADTTLNQASFYLKF